MIRVLILILAMTSCTTIGKKTPIIDQTTWERDLDRQNGF